MDLAGAAGTASRVEDRFEATPDQEALFAGYARNPSSGAYVESLAFRLIGPLQADILDKALQAVARRHAPLRSVFRLARGRLEQVVLAGVPRLERADAADGVPAEWLARLSGKPFDLEAGPVARLGLYRLARDDHLLCVAAHHIVCDGWSRGVLLRDLSALYEALRFGRPADLPDLQSGYADFAGATRDPAGRGCRAAAEAFWRRELEGCPLPPQRPLGGERLAAPDAVGEVEVDWSDLSVVLTDAASRSACSPFVLVLTLLRQALFEQTQAEDVTIAIDFAGREKSTELLIGFFARQLPIRFRDPPSSLAAAVRTTKDLVVAALAHADLTYAEIAAQAGAEEIFAVKLSIEQDMDSTLRLPGLTCESLRTRLPAAKFPLLLNGRLAAGRLTIRAEFDARRVARTSVDRLLNRVRALMQQLGPAAARPASRFARRRIGTDGGIVAGSDGEVPDAIRLFRATGTLTPTDLVCLKDALLHSGAVLVRGLPRVEAAGLGQLLHPVIGPLMPYVERTSPRTKLAEGVYSSTEFPASRVIAMHNENSYASRWPRWIAFLCMEPAAIGGRTPIANAAAVLGRLPHELREEFTHRGLEYTRRFGGPFGPAATMAFGSEVDQLEARLATAGYSSIRDGSGKLTTSRRGPAVRLHPSLGTPVWFNHAYFFHPAREALSGLSGEAVEALAYDVTFGDRGRIPDDAVAAIGAAYQAERLVFDWRGGDLLLLDNMLFAHGREAFVGSRRLWAALGQEIVDGQ